MTIKLDYSLESPEERTILVAQICEVTPKHQLTNRYKEIMADYIVFAMNKQERKEKKILTEGRMVTVNKRETSFEALVDRLENGEDGLYNLINTDKNTLLSPKDCISEQDIMDIPALKLLVDEIARMEPLAKAAIGTGKKAFDMRKAIIQMRQDQYVIRNAAKEPMKANSLIKSLCRLSLEEEVYLDEFDKLHSTGIVNLYDPHHVSALLCHYPLLKEETYEDMSLDMRWMMIDLDNLVDRALMRQHPLLYDLLIYKIDGKTNLEIQDLLDREYGITHSLEYLSSLWRHKIPKLIAAKAQEEWLIHNFGKKKKCSRCGQIKPAHNHFFSKNKTSKDGYYSICKHCRNTKEKGE